MNPPLPHENELIGQWREMAGEIVADEMCQRIQRLVDTSLVKLAVDRTGWLTLFKDPQDSRLWELSYPRGEMHGGGPPKLACVTRQYAEAVYGREALSI